MTRPVAILREPRPIVGPEHTSNTLFETPEWLDAVAPAGWEAATVEENGRVVARLPYLTKSRAGLRVLSVPPLTPWLGPWVAPGPGKYQARLGREHDLLGRLLQQLPPVDAAIIPVAPEQTNLLPFHWHGFELKLGYTYRIALDHSMEALWQALKKGTRADIRKAAEQLDVAATEDLDEVARLIAMTYRRQGLAPPPLAATIARILESSALRPHRELLLARDHAGRAHAFALLARDARHSFYVAGGADPDLRSSGAQSLLLWRAIEQSFGRSTVFDFEGSMKLEIERSFRSFGAVQTAQITAIAHKTMLGIGYHLLTWMKTPRRFVDTTQPSGSAEANHSGRRQQ